MAGKSDRLLFLKSGEGRRYGMGGLTALFKADEAETDSRYSVSEWCLQPGQPGVGAHSHDQNDEVFYILEGTPEILAGENWIACPRDTFIRIPAGMTHDFRNLGDAPARLLNLFIPGGFERNMPAIVDWFAAEEGQEGA